MSTVPVPAGAVAVIWVAELTVNELAAVDPNATAVAPVKPGAGDRDRGPAGLRPVVGLTLVTVGRARCT